MFLLFNLVAGEHRAKFLCYARAHCSSFWSLFVLAFFVYLHCHIELYRFREWNRSQLLQGVRFPSSATAQASISNTISITKFQITFSTWNLSYDNWRNKETNWKKERKKEKRQKQQQQKCRRLSIEKIRVTKKVDSLHWDKQVRCCCEWTMDGMCTVCAIRRWRKEERQILIGLSYCAFCL